MSALTLLKGGVGKTATAINMSVGLHNLGYKVAAIDLDPQGQLAEGFGIDRKSLKKTMLLTPQRLQAMMLRRSWLINRHTLIHTSKKARNHYGGGYDRRFLNVKEIAHDRHGG